MCDSDSNCGKAGTEFLFCPLMQANIFPGHRWQRLCLMFQGNPGLARECHRNLPAFALAFVPSRYARHLEAVIERQLIGWNGSRLRPREIVGGSRREHRCVFRGNKGALRIPFYSFQLLRRPECSAKLLCFHTAGGFDPHRPYQTSESLK
jgi:hypothetical protein